MTTTDSRNLNNKQEILRRLASDEDYYGDFGNQFLSNSHIGKLLKDPASFRQPTVKTVPMVVGGYFHTLICEPDKVDSFKIIPSKSRNSKIYKDLSDGEICLLETEADHIAKMRDTMLDNNIIRDLITNKNNEYEQPAIDMICGEWWKGKADIVNHDEKLIIDLKTTSNIDAFRASSKKFNYDSQAYLYQELFGYEFIFIVVDKNTLKLGIYDCSQHFIQSGREKVVEAVTAYRTFYKDGEFDFKQFHITETL